MTRERRREQEMEELEKAVQDTEEPCVEGAPIFLMVKPRQLLKKGLEKMLLNRDLILTNFLNPVQCRALTHKTSRTYTTFLKETPHNSRLIPIW